ncbi:MAG: hypothetical protein JWR19_2085 [Pedosphaera sp.]|nr:hypothetical protein [Pedosphaera sp.]
MHPGAILTDFVLRLHLIHSLKLNIRLAHGNYNDWLALASPNLVAPASQLIIPTPLRLFIDKLHAN